MAARSRPNPLIPTPRAAVPVLVLSLATMPMVMTMTGCPPVPEAQTEITGNLAEVRIKGARYTLEVAAVPDVRTKGLGGRTEIAETGGMIFVFPPSQVDVHEFVMRDCPIDIDIIYTDGIGRVLAVHEMKAEPARGSLKDADGKPVYEGEPGDFDLNKLPTRERFDGALKYESRLKRYSSKFRSTFAIELRAGSIKKLGVKEGDVVDFDHAGLKKMAR